MYTCPECGCCCDHDKPCCQQFGGGNTDHLGSGADANSLTPALSPQSSASAPVVPAETSFCIRSCPHL